MNEKTKNAVNEYKDASTFSLSQAMVSAQQLVAYAASNSKDVKPDVLKTLVGIKYLQDDLTPEKEEAFWQAYSEISRVVRPVTPTSLQATLNTRPVIKRFQIWTIVAIVILLLFQVYWVLLTTLLKAVNENYQNIQSTLLEYSNEWNDLVALGSSYGIEGTANVDSKNWEKLQDKSARDKGIAILNKYQQTYARSSALINAHNRDYHFLYLIDVFTTKIASNDKNGAITAMDAMLNAQNTSTASTVTATVLTTYILPILYGLVGACAYILRVLSEYIENNTFTNAISVRLRLRLLLGILAGLSIAWFFNPESLTTTAGHITPLALAFVAGYSVELLFSAMDAIISAFTRKETSLTKP